MASRVILYIEMKIKTETQLLDVLTESSTEEFQGQSHIAGASGKGAGHVGTALPRSFNAREGKERLGEVEAKGRCIFVGGAR